MKWCLSNLVLILDWKIGFVWQDTLWIGECRRAEENEEKGQLLAFKQTSTIWEERVSLFLRQRNIWVSFQAEKSYSEKSVCDEGGAQVIIKQLVG